MILNAQSVNPPFLSQAPEINNLDSGSTVDNTAVTLAAPRILNFQGSSGLWGQYTARIENGLGFARELRIQNASDIAGPSDPTGFYIAVWSDDPHSDRWHKLAYDDVVDNQIRFLDKLPSRGSVAVARVPWYTVTRVYRQTRNTLSKKFVSTTPSAPTGIHNTQVSPSDWKGRSVPDLPLPAFMIHEGGTSNKNVVVLTAGNHPYEAQADYNLEGSVNFILSDDPVAQNLREWCVFYVYPTINPAGRFAGYSRSNPELKNAGEDDFNRVWGTSGSHDVIDKMKSAFQSDFNSECDVLIDYHSFFFNESTTLRGIWAPDEVQNSGFMANYGLREPDSFNNRLVGSTSNVQTLPEFAIASMGASVAVHSEETASTSRNVVEYRRSGKALMEGLWDTIVDGLLSHGPNN